MTMQIKNDGLENYVFGKVQPQALPLEEAVLGAILLDSNALTIVLDILKPESFYLNAHNLIYVAFLELYELNLPIDSLTVVEQLKKRNELEIIGGPLFIANLTNRIGSSANIEAHARMLSEKKMRRDLIVLAQAVLKDSYEEAKDVFDLMESVETTIFEVTQAMLTKSSQRIGSIAIQELKNMEAISKMEGMAGIPVNLLAVDKILKGSRKTDFIILAARPAMGKTSYALQLARECAMTEKRPCAIFSLEMGEKQLVSRIISAETGINGFKLRDAELDESEWATVNEQVVKLSEVPIYIDDTAGISLFEMRAKARRLKMQFGIEMIIIDYLQLMKAGGNFKGSREQEVSAISRGLKEMAKELDIPVIALSQLSRAVETRGGSKRPMLSDLRESGSLEQDADVVTFLYRPEYYGILEDDEGQSLKGVTELIIAKHRGGSTDTANIQFNPTTTSFEDLPDSDFANLIPQQKPHTPLPNHNNLTGRRNNDDIPF